MLKVLIIGHGRHGKDTVAEILKDSYSFKFTSSSLFCLNETIWPNWGCAVYETPEQCYEDRSNHRKLWADMITAYNTPDKTKTANTMFQRGYDLYVGMRRRAELDACNAIGLFDHVMWVDRSEHLPLEPFESMEFTADDANIFIDNNGDLSQLGLEIEKAMEFIGVPENETS